MNPFHADFRELYARHLCRHSQFGINVLHLIAVAVIYVALLGMVAALPGAIWIVAVAVSIYAALLARNIPPGLLMVNLLMIAVFVAVFLWLPRMSVWIYSVSVVL